MKLSLAGASDFSNRRTAHSSKHRRHTPLSQSSTTQERDFYQENSDDNSQSYSSHQQDIIPVSGDDDDETIADSQLASYSSDNYPSITSSSAAAITSYINVAPLPTFRGSPDECPVAHLSRFDRVCRANNAAAPTTAARIFPVTLDAEAALWYELAVEPNPFTPWPEVRSAFVRAYRRPDFADRFRAELMSMRQGEDEGVNTYHLRMRWILKRWPEHGMPDSLLTGIFVDGLREDFREWVMPQRPASLEKAVQLAMAWEGVRRRRSEARCGFCEGLHEEGGCEVRRRMRELWIRSKTEGSLALPETTTGGGGGGGGNEKGSTVGEEEGVGVGRSLSMRRRGAQCQCWKHQCWKKLERSNSAIPDGNPTPND